jgi:ATP phosphoribosyltransferase
MRALIERFLAIAGTPDQAAAALRALAADAKIALGPAIELLENRKGFIAARGIDIARIQFSTSFGRGIDYYTGVVFELHDPNTEVVGQLVAGGRYDDCSHGSALKADPGRRLRGLDRSRRGLRGRLMSAPFVIAVPSKGRLQENTAAFFARAGLTLVKPGGARDYRGTIASLSGVDVAYLSSSEIVAQLAQGLAHFGITGEDLVREQIPRAEARVVLIDELGFGHANVVVAVPQAWIDVRDMADLDDVATAFRLRHGRKMRVATKYINLTRDFFTRHA